MSTRYIVSVLGQGRMTEVNSGGGLPAGWQNPGFDDSLWPVPVLRTTASGDNFHFPTAIPGGPGGSHALVEIDSPQTNAFPRTDGYRFHFILPAIPIGLTILSATMQLNVIQSGSFTGATVYINGFTVAASAGSSGSIPIPITVSPSVFVKGDNLIAIANVWDSPYNGGMEFSLTLVTSTPQPDWLITAEPGTGITDQSRRLYLGTGAQHSFTLQSRQRGSATYTLVVSAGDNYSPTIGQPIWLWDQNSQGFTNVFTGLLQDFKNRQIGINGDRFIDCTAASLESVFDTVYAPPMQFVNQTCGQIVTALFTALESLSQVGLGTISDGPAIPLFVTNYEKLSDLFTQLATTAGFVWGVYPDSQNLYFCLPSTVAAPFALTSQNAMWDTFSWSFDAADYRNRQAVRLSYDAFSHSAEFFTGAGQTSFTLMRPVNQVTNCYITLSTCNKATGTFTGQPAVGDTVTIGPSTGNAWLPSHIYGLNGQIVVNGYVQQVTTAGTSGGSVPTFSTVTGATVQDNSVIWTCMGPLNLATGQDVYTFVNPAPVLVWVPSHAYSFGDKIYQAGFLQQVTSAGTSGSVAPAFSNTLGVTTPDGSGALVWTNEGACLDNTQFGQVAIGANSTATCKNLIDAINSRAAVRGITFSLPTWECNTCLAVGQVLGVFTLQQKGAGSGWISSISTTSANFSWSSAVTTGGTSPQGSVGPNSGATISIQVYASGQSTAAPGLAYTQGSAVVNLATPLNVGTNMNIEYTRMDGNVIEVENTPLVNALANVTYGTGEYQQITDQSSQGLISTSNIAGLQLAQQALAAYDVVPEAIEVEILQAGILPGQQVTIALAGPLGTALNGTYFVESVSGQLVPVWPYMDNLQQCPGAGHYRYTLKLINITQIGSWMDFWGKMGGSGGGSGSGGGGSAGGAVSATSGSSTGATQGTALTVGAINLQTANYTAIATDYGKVIVFNSSSALTLKLPVLPFVPTFPQWWIQVENIGTGLLTIDRNGQLIDGVASNLFRGKNGGVTITSDGTNFYTARNGPLVETGGVVNSDQGLVNLVGSGGITITEAAGTVTINGTGAGGGEDFAKLQQVITTGSQTTVVFPSIDQSYYALKIIWHARSLSAGSGIDSLVVNFNSDVAANYNWNFSFATNSSTGAGSSNPASGGLVGALSQNGVVAGCVGGGEITIEGYTQTAFFKPFHSIASWQQGAAGSQTSGQDTYTGNWRNTGSAINQITITINTGAGFVDLSTFKLYGIK